MKFAGLIWLLMIPAALRAQSGPVSSSLLNPGISVIGDFRGRYFDDSDRRPEFSFEEAELSFISSIDPYARADFYVSFGRTPEGEIEGELEEAYLTTTSLPFNLALKAGRFRMPLGRINAVHPHAYPFSDVPAAVESYFGEEGLSDDGISVAWIVPNPFDFYQEIEIAAGNVSRESPLFSPPTGGRYLFSARLKNFWDLDENTTLELGFGGLTGPNHLSLTSTLGAIDLTVKWKPLQFNRYKSLVWQSELYFNSYGIDGGEPLETWGTYSYLTWQSGQRWFLTGRFDYVNPPLTPEVAERGYSATVGWYATEYQKIELGGTLRTSNAEQAHTGFTLRWVFVIGAHGAHKY